MRRSFDAQPVELYGLLSEIDQGRIALPDFQRSFVWESAAITKLITSIAQRYPAGSLLLWNPGTTEMQWRPVENASNQISSPPSQVILDGQQRLTSVYQAIYGKGDNRFYLDLQPLINGSPLDEDHILVLSIEEETKQDLTHPLQQVRRRLFPLAALKGGQAAFRSWKKLARREEPSTGSANALEDALDAIEDDLIASIANYEFPVVTLSKETPLDAVCRIFETVNSTGKPLSTFELLTARFWPQGINLRDRWESATQAEPLIDSFDVDPYYALQIVSLLSYDPPKCNPKAVTELKVASIESNWQKAVTGLREALDFLQSDVGVITRNWLPYDPMIIPLAAFMGSRSPEAGPQEGSTRVNLRRWYWCSVFSQAYEQGASSRAAADFQVLLSWLGSRRGQVPDVISSFKFDPELLRKVTTKQRALYRACMSMIIRKRICDIHTGTQITEDQLAAKRTHSHHIFPKKMLSELNIEGDIVDCVLNRTLVGSRTNSSIGKTSPSIYFGSIQSALGDKFAEVLEGHLIPLGEESPIWTDDFDEFVRIREALYWSEIQALTGSKEDCTSGNTVESGPESKVRAAD
jgi:hypothetical protein